MGSLSDDLDRFLKTDGLRIIRDSTNIRAGISEPLTEEDINDFDCMNLDELNTEDLEDLRDKAEDLRDHLEDQEPEDENSEEHALWEDKFFRIEDFIDRIKGFSGSSK